MNAWKRRKLKMEKASREPWIVCEQPPKSNAVERVHTERILVKS